MCQKPLVWDKCCNESSLGYNRSMKFEYTEGEGGLKSASYKKCCRVIHKRVIK